MQQLVLSVFLTTIWVGHCVKLYSFNDPCGEKLLFQHQAQKQVTRRKKADESEAGDKKKKNDVINTEHWHFPQPFKQEMFWWKQTGVLLRGVAKKKEKEKMKKEKKKLHKKHKQGGWKLLEQVAMQFCGTWI